MKGNKNNSQFSASTLQRFAREYQWTYVVVKIRKYSRQVREDVADSTIQSVIEGQKWCGTTENARQNLKNASCTGSLNSVISCKLKYKPSRTDRSLIHH